MKLSKLEKARSIYDQLKNLDEECRRIEQVANECAFDEVELVFAIGINNISNAEHEKSEVTFDEDGSLVFGERKQLESMFGWMYASSSPKEQKQTGRIESFYFREKHCMEVLGLILKQRNERRAYLLGELKKLGIE